MWFMKLCFQETNLSDNIPLKLDMQKLPAQAGNLSLQKYCNQYIFLFMYSFKKYTF